MRARNRSRSWLAVAVVLTVAAASCQQSEAPPPQKQSQPRDDHHAQPTPVAPPAAVTAPIDVGIGRRRDVTSFVGSAERAAIGDLDGDGKNEIVLADQQRLWVVDPTGHELASIPAPGGIEVLVVAHVAGDPHAEILAGWGMSRDHKTATTRVSAYRYAAGQLAEDVIVAPTSARAEVTAIVPASDGKLVVAYFDSKYTVHSVYATRARSKWSTEDIATIRMATAYARADIDGDGVLDLIVGRTYGDDIGVDGDAFVLRPDGTRTKIPTLRGVRSLATADRDGDGHPEIYLADGWHQDYAHVARGLLTEATWSAGSAQVHVIEDTAGQYSDGRLVPADLDGDGKAAIVSLGSQFVRVFRHAGGTWTGVSIAGVARDVAVGDLDGVAGDEILVISERSQVISLHE